MIELHPFTESDFQRLIRWIDSPETCFLWGAQTFSYPISAETLRTHWQETQGNFPKKAAFKAVDREGLGVIGYLDLDRIDYEEHSAAICRVIIDPKLQGHGLGKAMVNALFSYAFHSLNLETLTLNVFDSNERAIETYRKAGFVKTGIKTNYAKYQGEERSVICMRITKARWLQMNKNSMVSWAFPTTLYFVQIISITLNIRPLGFSLPKLETAGACS